MMAVNEADLRQLLSEVSFTRQFGFQLHSFADGECVRMDDGSVAAEIRAEA
jgi:hypothetical protein